MKPLFDFKDITSSSSVRELRVPSWPWMSYTKKIQYATFATSTISWRTDHDIVFHCTENRFILSASLVQLSSDCRFTPHGDMECNINNQNGDVVGWIRYDCEDNCNTESREYIILGEGKTGWREYSSDLESDEPSNIFHYVLLVSSIDNGKYRRVGIGVITSQWVSISPSKDSVQIF